MPADWLLIWACIKTGVIYLRLRFPHSMQKYEMLSFGVASRLTGTIHLHIVYPNTNIDRHRLWSLYLGRPGYIKLADVSIRLPERNGTSWDLTMFAAWVELLDLAGQISDKLYEWSIPTCARRF